MPKRKKRSDGNQKRSHTALCDNQDCDNSLIDDHDLDVMIRMLKEDYEIPQERLVTGWQSPFHYAITSMAEQELIHVHYRGHRDEYRLKQLTYGLKDLGRKGCIARVSPSIGQLDALKHLDLYYSEGPLPPEIGQLSNLEKLAIYTTDKSAVPPEMGNLRMLKELVLDCPYMESLFKDVGNFSNLKILRLTECILLTELPSSMGQLTKLERLEISTDIEDKDVWKFPFVIRQLSSLKYLMIGSNNKSGRWYRSLEAFRVGPAGDIEALHASQEVANLASLKEVCTLLSALLCFPVNYFANSTKLTKMKIVCDVMGFSSRDVPHFSNIPSTLKDLKVHTNTQDGYDDSDDDPEEEEEVDVEDNDVWQTFPKVLFPLQALAWQHNLRNLRIDGTGSAGIPLSFSTMKNLVQLEYMQLERCNILESEALPTTSVICLPRLRQVSLKDIKGTIDFQELNLPSLKLFDLLHFMENKRKITVRVSGLLPALAALAIRSCDVKAKHTIGMDESHTYDGGMDKLIIFEYDATAELPKLHRLHLDRCFFFGNTDGTAPPIEALDLPCLQDLTFDTCFGIFSSPSKFHLSNWLTPGLRSIRFCHNWQQLDAIPICQQLDKLTTQLLARCPQLIRLDLSGMPNGTIRSLPKAAMSFLPQSIRGINLAGPAISFADDTDTSLELLGRCQLLGSIDYFRGCQTNRILAVPLPSIAECHKIGHLMSLNRARCRLFHGRQGVIAALWPLILEYPLRAFKCYGTELFPKDDVDDSEVWQKFYDGTDDEEEEYVTEEDSNKSEWTDDEEEVEEKEKKMKGNDSEETNNDYGIRDALPHSEVVEHDGTDDDEDDDETEQEISDREGIDVDDMEEDHDENDEEEAEGLNGLFVDMMRFGVEMEEVLEESGDDGPDDDEEHDERAEEVSDREGIDVDESEEDHDENDEEEEEGIVGDAVSYVDVTDVKKDATERSNLVRRGAQTQSDAIFLLLRERLFPLELLFDRV